MAEVTGRGVGAEEGRSEEECGEEAGPSEERDGAFVVRASRRLPSRSLAARLLASPARSVTAPAPLGPWSVSLRVRTLAGLVYHRRGWWTPARLGPTTSTSETPTERQAVADPRFPDPPVLPLRFLQADPRLFVFSPFDKAQSSALNYVCGSEKPLRLRLRWVEDEEEAGREALVERTSERAPLAYPGLTAQLDKDVLEEGESGELRVAWSGTEQPRLARPFPLELHYEPLGEGLGRSECGGGRLEAEVLFRSLPRLRALPEGSPGHLLLYRPHKGSAVQLHLEVLTGHCCWITVTPHSVRQMRILHLPPGWHDTGKTVCSSDFFQPEDWERRRAELKVEYWETGDGEIEAAFPQLMEGVGWAEGMNRFLRHVERAAERPVQSLRVPVLFSPEAALSFGGCQSPEPVALHLFKPSFVALRNRAPVEAHWLAVAGESVAVVPDSGVLAGEGSQPLSLRLHRQARGWRAGETELSVFFSLGSRPNSLLFPDDPKRVTRISILLHEE